MGSSVLVPSEHPKAARAPSATNGVQVRFLMTLPCVFCGLRPGLLGASLLAKGPLPRGGTYIVCNSALFKHSLCHFSLSREPVTNCLKLNKIHLAWGSLDQSWLPNMETLRSR